MDANVKQKVQMPMGIRKKMMAAISMLLVASIMMVSSSYAWFTLSTAPEITGITTSVGANGNLEVALLPADGDATKITSSTGDSMAVKPVNEANITWGNLVDLSDSAYYGLDKITLYPSALNGVTGKIATNALSIPEYGADGRVAELVSTTATAGYNAEKGTFEVNDAAGYGVRAVGTSSNITARALTFKSAKSTYTAKSNGLANPTRNAVNQNIDVFMGIALAGGAPSEFSRDQVLAMQKIANGVKTSLNNTVNAYANAGLAKAASVSMAETVTDEEVALLATAISGETSAARLQTTLNTAGISYGALTELANAQTKNDAVITAISNLLATGNGPYAASAVQDSIATPLLGSSADIKAYNEAGELTEFSASSYSNVKTLYLGGGTIGAVANYSGPFKITNVLGIDLYGGANGTSAAINAVTTEVNGLTAPSGEGAANLTDFYGYIIDFAFRTNAAESNLQLATEAINRVYSDATGENLATMGHGSTGTFTYTQGSGLTQTQGTKLMEAIRVAFFDTSTGDLLKVAKFTEITPTNTAATGKLKLFDYSATPDDKVLLGKDAFSEAVTTYQLADSKYTESNCTNYPVDDQGALKALTANEYNALAEKTESVANGSEWSHTLGKDAFKAVTLHQAKDNLTVGDTSFALTTDACWNYAATITPAQYALLKDVSAKETRYTVNLTEATNTALTALEQNTPKKLSVLVYMDGENIDNSSVGNALSSGTLDLNLQFSSSANLVPMQNNTLKNMEKTAAAAAAVSEDLTPEEIEIVEGE